jgi:dienelactone hydrolase
MTTAREMVKWGFVCIGTNYTFAGKPGVHRVPVRRLAAAPPSAVRNPNPPASSAADRAENLKRGAKCIEILESLPYVDPRRIVLYGNSAGAIMTIALSGAFPGKIAAAAMTAGGIGGRFVTPELAEKIRCPFLMIHGSVDPLVPPEASLQLKEILDRNHVPNQRKVFDGIGHNVNVDKRDEVNALVREWFTKYGILR